MFSKYIDSCVYSAREIFNGATDGKDECRSFAIEEVARKDTKLEVKLSKIRSKYPQHVNSQTNQ